MHDRYGAVIITVIPVPVVQTPFKQVIDVIAMRNLFMTTVVVSASAGNRLTFGRIGRAHGKRVFVVVTFMGSM